MITAQSARTEFITVNIVSNGRLPNSNTTGVSRTSQPETGTKIAYRRLGLSKGVALVLHMHFRGTMDFWDPALLNALGSARPLLIFDSAGIGQSSGSIPTTFAGWADVVIALLSALNLTEIDLLGFSMGGAAVQMVALNAPKGLVRKLILAGTAPSVHSATEHADMAPFWQLASADATSREDMGRACKDTFFHMELPSGRIAAAEYWQRICDGIDDRHRRHSQGDKGDTAPFQAVSVEDAKQQALAWRHWYKSANSQQNSFPRLKELTMPLLVANGDVDVLIPTHGSWILAKHIPHADLVIYADSGHGFLFQYAERFAREVNSFLDRAHHERKTAKL